VARLRDRAGRQRPRTVYTDPGRYGVLTGEWTPPTPAAADSHPSGPAYDARDGDVVLVTHDHHWDPDGVTRVADADATLAERLDPDLVCPVHYDTFDRLAADSGAFAADVATRGVPVVLDEEWT